MRRTLLLLTIFIPSLALAQISYPPIDDSSGYVVNEGGNSLVGMLFLNDVGVPVTPASYCVIVNDEDSGLNLIAKCNAASSSAVEVDLSPDAHRIIDETKAQEVHIMSVYWAYTQTGQTRFGSRAFRLIVNNDPNIYVGSAPTPTGTAGGGRTWGPTAFPRNTPTPR